MNDLPEPGTPRHRLMLAAIEAEQQKMLRREFADFFTALTTANDSWPPISDDQLTTAIAQALGDMSERRRNGSRLLRDVVLKLQTLDQLNPPTH
jgi:hypothetical protein